MGSLAFGFTQLIQLFAALIRREFAALIRREFAALIRREFAALIRSISHTTNRI